MFDTLATEMLFMLGFLAAGPILISLVIITGILRALHADQLNLDNQEYLDKLDKQMIEDNEGLSENSPQETLANSDKNKEASND